MAITNQERVGKALELLKAGLKPFVEREMAAQFGPKWTQELQEIVRDTRLGSKGDVLKDVAVQLVIMDRKWKEVFGNTLGKAERSLVNEILDVRNRWAHQDAFSGNDADRALDSIERMLTAVSAAEADEVARMKMELRRLIFEEQSRSERRKSAGTIEALVTGALTPWREVVTPHKDVASGRYQQAEFAADLWQVHLNEGSDEYRNPKEFFRRTYLTQSLKDLLAGSMRRLGGQGGDPVVQLQTNFGGGKTHSMLALYHLCSGAKAGDLLGVEELMKASEISKLPERVNRVVLVGNKISPGNPSVKPDGTKVATLWGELAWQLGFAAGGAKEAKKAFEKVKGDDEKATNPGDTLRALLNTYAPSLILIDEWVAYARQLHEEADLPGGSFETHFTFAQALTEAAKGANKCLLVISLPASDTATSPHAQGVDEEVGGLRGRQALARLRNVIGRVESSWSPASTEEGFEIVRRRLFEPMLEKAHFTARDNVARAFADHYKAQHQEFPSECRNSEYETRLRAAYPIHPEVFDRLYTDWSTLVKFQRTRGVLRLMAAVIHSLWERGDRNPLIMPSNIPLDELRVRDELSRYLPDQWKPVIEKDIDGAGSLPLQIDGEQPNLGKLAATRRVARTIYLGSAPISDAASKGLDDRRIKLGCVMPGESPPVFGDALRRLSEKATYLYHDDTRYWYSTQTSVTKTAADIEVEIGRKPDLYVVEIEKRLKDDLKHMGEFSRVHIAPKSGGDVTDDTSASLVVLDPDQAWNKSDSNKATAAAKKILEQRGSGPRLYQNALVFLAPDEARLPDLIAAVCRFLAWQRIIDEKEALNLPPQQVKLADSQLKVADTTVRARLPETYNRVLVPTQSNPASPIKWEALTISGDGNLAARAVKKLKNEELLLTSLAGARLRMDLDKVPLWRGDHVAVKQLAEDFARYIYLPRLKSSNALVMAVQDGMGLLTWKNDTFAYADGYDEAKRRYLGLRCGQQALVTQDVMTGLLVKSEVAVKQQAEEEPATDPTAAPGLSEPKPGTSAGGTPPTSPVKPRAPKRYYGTVTLDAARVGRDAGRIADEVIAHLAGLVGSELKVTLEIEARIPAGTPENVVRTVTENGRTLKFTSQGFEEE